MTKERLTQEYFEWMCHLVCKDKEVGRRSWQKLLGCLHEHPFIWLMDMDENRANDGILLRDRFAYERNYNRTDIWHNWDVERSSVLEMMVALALRCEEHIMGDPDIGDRTGKWFWEMIRNLGLATMDDEHFNRRLVDRRLERFVLREYGADGTGGLFKTQRRKQDMRKVEIWYQMMIYLDECQ